MLLAFAGWTLATLMAGVGWRRWALIFTGRADLTCFPGDTPHGSAAYRRAMRAHANCIENLPVFGALVLIPASAHLSVPAMGCLSALVMAARILQTGIHMVLPETNLTVGLRFTAFLAQILAMIAMGILIAFCAASR
jgi:uncharacterized MAPEG superfamily protein